MRWEVEYSDEFGQWWDGLSEAEQDAIDVVVRILEERGPQLGFPYSTSVVGSRHGHMRELRIQHRGQPYRVLYAFDPRRTAVLLIGGRKTGDDRWYDEFVPRADRLYDEHLDELRKEGQIDGA
ncbi:MAG: type II toxin-antitoxin system RelE/ParE family toxin [Gemmatimonadales bacterium]|jgi:hypothetical protein